MLKLSKSELWTSKMPLKFHQHLLKNIFYKVVKMLKKKASVSDAMSWYAVYDLHVLPTWGGSKFPQAFSTVFFKGYWPIGQGFSVEMGILGATLVLFYVPNFRIWPWDLHHFQLLLIIFNHHLRSARGQSHQPIEI